MRAGNFHGVTNHQAAFIARRPHARTPRGVRATTLRSGEVKRHQTDATRAA